MMSNPADSGSGVRSRRGTPKQDGLASYPETVGTHAPSLVST
ncbi:MAG: hypothetical protein ACLGGO_23270 [Coleofasciculus sp.]